MSDAPIAAHPTDHPGPVRRHWLELTVPLCCLAVLMIAVAFASERRDGSAPASLVYWAGQLLLFGTVTVAALARGVNRCGRLGAVMMFTVAEYAIKWMHSPTQLRFPDELQHWQTTLGMLESDRLFPANTSLPISPVFPGLEAIAVFVMRVTGLEFFPTAIGVGLVCTLLATGAVWCLAERVTTRADIAAVVTLLYLLNPHHGFFTSSYLYVTPALAFLFVLLLKLADLLFASRARRSDARLGTIAGLALVVTHHVTLMIGLALLVAAGLATLVVPRLRPRRWPVWVLVAPIVFASLLWVSVIATGVVSYLRNPIEELMRRRGPGWRGSHHSTARGSSGPSAGRGAVLDWRRSRRGPGADSHWRRTAVPPPDRGGGVVRGRRRRAWVVCWSVGPSVRPTRSSDARSPTSRSGRRWCSATERRPSPLRRRPAASD